MFGQITINLGRIFPFPFVTPRTRSQIYTHYYNSKLIWRTVSHRVDEVIPLDHPRCEASTRHDTVRQIKLLL